MTLEDRVRAASARYDDDRGTLAASALAALARRQATAGKRCNRCAQHLRHADFKTDTSRTDGLYPTCKRCVMVGRV